MAENRLLVDRQDDILTLTINRPEKRNALSLVLLDELAATLGAHQEDEKLRCAVITAAGDRCFAAGGDLKELDAVRTEADAAAMSRRGRRALDTVREFPLPVIGGLNGLALGGGAELAMACDLRVASANTEIGFLQAQLNVTTAWGGGIDLMIALGNHQALELLATARRVSAGEAQTLGIINYLCGPEETIQDGLKNYLRTWRQRSPSVLRGFKAMAIKSRMALHRELSTTEESNLAKTWAHQDHWDAVNAAARKREQYRSKP
ncbi:MAG: enoyl-CoA hydratase/isomerase family protein [Gammaproteobacteria bacterium]